MDSIVNTVKSSYGHVYVEHYVQRAVTVLTEAEYKVVKELIRRGERVKAIRMVRALHDLTLFQATELLKEITLRMD